jgi:hypothetical protein
MPIKTYLEQLEEVQAAITAVMSGQEYEIADRRLKRPDLEWLQKREQYLRPLAIREQSGRGRITTVIPHD